MGKRITIEFIKQFAKEKGGECISVEYINPKMPIKWKCLHGHIWKSPWKSMYDGRWCRECHVESIKLGIGVAQKIAKERNGKCLSIKYINWKSKLEWKCDKGHKWSACLDNIKNKKQWCPDCAFDRRRLSIKDCIAAAAKFGGKCLSTEYKMAKSKIRWCCEKGHEWDAVASGVFYCNKWCPRCRDKSQNMLANNIKEIYAGCVVEQKYRGFKWLDTKNGGRQELDIWLPEIKLAIEYDGQGHFYPVNFGGCDNETAKKIFEKTKRLDKIKNRKIKKHLDDIKHFIRFSYKDNIFDIELVKKKLIDNNITIGDINE